MEKYEMAKVLMKALRVLGVKAGLSPDNAETLVVQAGNVSLCDGYPGILDIVNDHRIRAGLRAGQGFRNMETKAMFDFLNTPASDGLDRSFGSADDLKAIEKAGISNFIEVVSRMDQIVSEHLLAKADGCSALEHALGAWLWNVHMEEIAHKFYDATRWEKPASVIVEEVFVDINN